MNRDERIVRGAGELPEIHHRNGTTAVYPSDGAGGTWIAANEYGITLALLNWNDVVPRPLDDNKARSRGEIIPGLASAPSLTGLQAAFGALNLEGIRPFRFVGVFPSEQAIAEWGWDSVQLTFQTRGWHSRPLVFLEPFGPTGREFTWRCMPGRSTRTGCRLGAVVAKTSRVSRGRPRAIQLVCPPGRCQNAELYRGRCHARTNTNGAFPGQTLRYGCRW